MINDILRGWHDREKVGPFRYGEIKRDSYTVAQRLDDLNHDSKSMERWKMHCG